MAIYVAFATLLSVLIVFLLSDFAYSRYVAYRLRKWESSQEWDVGGVRVACREYTTGKGSAAILLVHGFNDSPRIFDRMAPELADAGFTVRAMRLPGFGIRLAGRPQIRREDWLAAVRGELTLLRADHRHVFIAGHSLGGALAIATLVEDPQLADGLALLTPVINVSRSRSPVLPPRQWHELSKRLLLFTQIALSPFSNDSVDPEYRGYRWGTKFSVRAYYEQLFLLLDNNRRIAPKLRTPVIMLLARRDKIIDIMAAEQFFHEAAANPKKLVFIENSGHALPLDYGWQDATRAMIAFFQALMARTHETAQDRAG